MANFLEQLKGITVVVADTGDFESIEEVQAARRDDQPLAHRDRRGDARVRELVDERARVGARAQPEAADATDVAKRAVDRLAVEFGIEILKIVPGRVSTEVDARLSYDTEASIDEGPRAHRACTRRPASSASAS